MLKEAITTHIDTCGAYIIQDPRQLEAASLAQIGNKVVIIDIASPELIKIAQATRIATQRLEALSFQGKMYAVRRSGKGGLFQVGQLLTINNDPSADHYLQGTGLGAKIPLGKLSLKAHWDVLKRKMIDFTQQHPNQFVQLFGVPKIMIRCEGELINHNMQLVEYLDNFTSLDDVMLQEDHPLNTHYNILNLLIQSGWCLSTMHSAGLTLGDYKPSNVVIGGNSQVRLNDYDLVNELNSPNAYPDMFSTEFCSFDTQSDHKVTIGDEAWTLGLMLLQLFPDEEKDIHVTDKGPWVAKFNVQTKLINVKANLITKYSQRYSCPPDTIESLINLMIKLLGAQRSDRPNNLGAPLEILQNVLRSITPTNAPQVNQTAATQLSTVNGNLTNHLATIVQAALNMLRRIESYVRPNTVNDKNGQLKQQN